MSIKAELIESDIREDRTVSDPADGVETYYCRLHTIVAERSNYIDFLRVVGDNGMTNVEVRVPFAFLIDAGWIPPKSQD